MVTEERHIKILEKLGEKPFAEVSELSAALGVSAETIRRDLKVLENAGQLKRVRGGAAAIDTQPAAKPQKNVPTAELAWYSPTRAPFKLCGFPFFETDGVYRRYPLNPPVPLPPKVEGLAWCTSGGQVRFTAELSKLAIRVKLSSPIEPFYNTTPLAAVGFDVYASDGDGKYTLYGVTWFDADPSVDSYTYQIINMPGRKELDILINFPIGTGIENVFIGIDRDSIPQSPPPFATDKRILIYGASIMHGYCASRPGMTMPNILSRRLNREVINLGVNGSALCEQEAAMSVRMVKNVEWLIVNSEGNCPSVQWIYDHLLAFLRCYREANPDTKIAVMSFMREGRERFNDEARQMRLAKKECQRKIVEQLAAEGDDKIFFWDAEEFTSPEEDIFFEGWSAGDECTVDTQHKSDLGFWLMANGICRRLAKE